MFVKELNNLLSQNNISCQNCVFHLIYGHQKSHCFRRNICFKILSVSDKKLTLEIRGLENGGTGELGSQNFNWLAELVCQCQSGPTVKVKCFF